MIIRCWDDIDNQICLLMLDKDLFIICGKYYDCWWPGDPRSQEISSHGIDLAFLEYTCVGTRRLTLYVVTDSVWSNNSTKQTLLLHRGLTSQGWGLLSQFPPFHYFLNFSEQPKHMLAIEYHVYIWQVSPQLSCVDTCQIWMWLK